MKFSDHDIRNFFWLNVLAIFILFICFIIGQFIILPKQFRGGWENRMYKLEVEIGEIKSRHQESHRYFNNNIKVLQNEIEGVKNEMWRNSESVEAINNMDINSHDPIIFVGD